MSKMFMEALADGTNFTLTENGANALRSTKSSLLDFFAVAGAIRSRNKAEVEKLFIDAFAEDKLLAMKSLFYTRDVRGGVGEREVFRIILKYMAINHPDVVIKNIENIPFFGRWDDLFVLFDTPIESQMMAFFLTQIMDDFDNMKAGKPVSLASKWAPSINTSSPKTVAMAKKLIKYAGTSEKSYRKVLSALRGYLNVVERDMSAKEWAKINYPTVPSKAMTLYRKAYSKQDTDRFCAYLQALEKGEAKVNAATLFPYDILQNAGLTASYRSFSLSKPEGILEAQWKALPNYVEGENNVLVMADTSGSMTMGNGRPLATSIGLAIYFAERNSGPYKNKFITFSSKPSFVEIKGNTLAEKVRSIPAIVENTNLEAAFDLILKTALDNNISASEMPKALVVISDMEMDGCQDWSNNSKPLTFHDTMKAKYARFGYELPNLCYWNCESRHDAHQATTTTPGVQLYSGQSPSVFKSLLQNMGTTPYEAMLTVLNDERYSVVAV